ncbi:MAG: hypothetical protein JXB30_09525 [Anaerolineae bacterium]|nr:hypothetical protein [Anaerolineae bacterium]
MAESPSDEKLFCTVHPTIETSLRCNKCNRPMCTKCAVRTPVGYRCKECVRGQQQIFYNARPIDLVIQGVVSFVLSLIGATLASLLGGGMLWIMLIVGLAVASGAGALIADIAHRAAGKRRGRYSWLIVAAGIVSGALVVAVVPTLLITVLYAQMIAGAAPEMMTEIPAGLSLIGLIGFTNIGWWIYVVVATGAAISRLRMGR